MSIFNLPDEDLKSDPKVRFLLQIGMLIAGAIFAGLVAYLLSTDQLVFAVALIAAPVGILFIHRYPFATIFIWLLLSPFLTFTNTPVERMVYWGVHRALPPATLIVILVADVLKIYKRRLPKLGVAEFCMIGYVLATIMSITLFSPSPLATFYQYYDRTIAPMFLYLVVRFSSPDQKDIQRLMPVILFIAVSQSVIGVLSWVAPEILPKEWLGREGTRTIGSLVNTPIFCATMIFCGLLLLHTSMSQRSRVARTLLYAGFILTLSLDFLAFSRAGWIGEILVLAGILIIYPRFVAGFTTAIVIISLLFGAVLLTQLSWVIDYANHRLYSDAAQVSAYSRLPVVMASIRMFLQKPILGWGYGNFDLYDRQFHVQIDGFIGDGRDHASHNFFLTVLAEQGITGLLLFMGPVIYWLSQTVKWYKNIPAVGLTNSKLPALLWLSILNQIILNNFSNLRVFFGWGIWWLALALIATVVHPVIADGETK
jgi:hypothetical protein